jgi:Pvc16 N-terminal domain
MSNSAAIAAVTATLRNLLTEGVTVDPDLVDATVTMQPLDRARVNGNSANQINIFLYHVLPSGTWRNAPYPGVTRPGETAQPVLGLNLYYLITAFGRDNDTQRPFSHQLIGRAMSTLHDHPLLGADEIKAALPNNDLWTQVERVRFTLQPFSVEEIAKLWTGFQTQYRLSVAYEAAVVLIESTRAVSAPLPVLTRGQADRGVTAQSNLLSPFPTIDSITMPKQQPSVLLGDTITLAGRNLSGDQVSVQFSNPRLAAPLVLPAGAGSSDSGITVAIPNDPANWLAGLYTVAAVVKTASDGERTSNEMPLAVAPQITSQLPLQMRLTQGTATTELSCAPQVLPEQRVALLLGSREIPAAARAAQTGALTFAITNAVAGDFWIRLRVDGVDSQLVDRSKTPPVFIATQKASIA